MAKNTGCKDKADDAAEVFEGRTKMFTCLDIAFKNNDQLKKNTALKMEAAKIEFKVI